MSSIKHTEMDLSLTTSFPKPSHALPTPPNSPQTNAKELRRQPSRFRLPKILRRAHTSDSAITATTTETQRSNSDKFTISKCSKQDGPSIQGFAVVCGMKEPFPELLPATQMPVAKDDSVTRTTSKKLRKTPKSYHNLRAFKSDMQLSSESTKTSMKLPALLPSPLPSDTAEGRSRNEYFAFHNPWKPVATQVNAVEAPYEYEGIVAGYCEDVVEDKIPSFGSTSVGARKAELSSLVPTEPQESTQEPNATRTPPTSNMSATLRSPKRDRSSSLSSEATWLSKSFARQDNSICMGQLERIQMNEKRLVEKSRRCCHLVEGPNIDLPASWTGERKASYATLIKPGKANDIWVPRSSSINLQSPNRSNSTRDADFPQTPERKLSEVSAFSPWDSPAERRDSERRNRHGDSPLRKVATYSNLRYSYKDYTPTKKPLFPTRKSSLGPVFSSPPLSIRASSSASTLGSDFTQPESLPQSPGGTHYDQAAWTKCANLTRILDDLSQSIDDYPTSLLQLDSSVILQTRSPQSLDELHLDRLRKIFPSTSTSNLSALAALLLAQSYLANLSPVSEPPPPTSAPISKYSHLAASSNESLNNIPTKAITTLGIRLANVTSVEERERALRKRAKVVETALHVVVQKMMVVVCGVYDEVLWRTLRCLVETVEQGW